MFSYSAFNVALTATQGRTILRNDLSQVSLYYYIQTIVCKLMISINIIQNCNATNILSFDLTSCKTK